MRSADWLLMGRVAGANVQFQMVEDLLQLWYFCPGPERLIQMFCCELAVISCRKHHQSGDSLARVL